VRYQVLKELEMRAKCFGPRVAGLAVVFVGALVSAVLSVSHERAVGVTAGVRRGISRTAPDWALTIGLTFGFSTPPIWRQ
jgi:hypothetical protein